MVNYGFNTDQNEEFKKIYQGQGHVLTVCHAHKVYLNLKKMTTFIVIANLYFK